MLILYRDIGYKMRKKIALCLMLVLVMGMTLQVSAATSGALSTCTLSISCDAEGVRVSFDENASGYADEIGCRNIILEEKNGSTWKKIPVEGGSRKNANFYGGTAIYRNATAGKTYRASCTHFAKFGSVEQTAPGSTGEMVYN